jgi:hypothetical protein|tara:strand:+ start:396 stop:521 length:126 start_codon:yes stop_codon:yes gene_type:complete
MFSRFRTDLSLVNILEEKYGEVTRMGRAAKKIAINSYASEH